MLLEIVGWLLCVLGAGCFLAGARMVKQAKDVGDVDFAAFVRILKEKGFDGYISIEHGSHHPPYETAAHEIRYLKRLIAGKL